MVREPFADHLRQPTDFLKRQLAPWADAGVVSCRGGPEERLAQVLFHIAASLQQNRQIILHVEMVLGGGDPVIGQRMVRVGFGADAALVMEGQFEDGIEMSPVRGSLVVLV